MRVFELAKQLEVPSKDLMKDLKGMGVSVSTHMAVLEDETVAKILAKSSMKTKKQPEAPPVKAAKTGKAKAAKPIQEKAEKEKGQASSLKPKAAAGRAALSSKPALPVAEEPKAEKKMVLVKRRPVESPVLDDLAPLRPAEEAPTSVSGAAELPKDAVLSMGPSAHEPSPSATVTMEPSVAPPPRQPAPALPSRAMVPPPPMAADTTRHPGGKKLAAPEPQPELKDKNKKTRRVGRGREDEPAPTRDDAARWRDMRAMPMHRREEKSRHVSTGATTEGTKPRLKAVKLAEGLTVKDFAEAVGQKPADVMRKLMDMGTMLTLNQLMPSDAALLLSESFGVKVEMVAERPAEDLLTESAEPDEEQVHRPPVVTIMGHVDHGKTSLLDAIRETRVTEGEAGGITQHIGAYVVRTQGKAITFLDTPGHEAFTAMRARGAKVTDLVVLVVAADDGVMPQTIEAIDHARAADVPLIVAVNKMDKPDANSDRIKNQLVERGLVPEAWGGETIYVEVSAKKKTGLDTLLEMILLQAEVLELRANPARLAKGTVIEAKVDRGRGPVATVLVLGAFV